VLKHAIQKRNTGLLDTDLQPDPNILTSQYGKKTRVFLIYLLVDGRIGIRANITEPGCPKAYRPVPEHLYFTDFRSDSRNADHIPGFAESWSGSRLFAE
jgi:hypothetical protein